MEKLSINHTMVGPETKFSDLGVDSLDMVELLIDFEKVFNISISDDDADNIATIGDADNI